jgi:cell shape-determining protein MreD
MNTIYRKTAAVLAFIIGAMAIFAGGQVVLLGKVMDYYVIDWLPVYNLIVGLLSAFVTSILIWRNNKFAMPAVLATLAAHLAVMLILLIGYGDVVAPDSIRAMTVRIVAWIIILGLTLFQQKRDQATSL